MGTTNNDISKTEERGVHVKRPSLVGNAGEFEGQIIELPERIRLGRHPQNDLCFSDPTVSAFHAQITAVGARYEIMDLGSKNRSKLNRKRIRRPVILADNDLIEIGKNSFHFRLPRSGDRVDTPSTPDPNTTSKPKARLQSSDGITHTQKTRGFGATHFNYASVQGELEQDTEKTVAQAVAELETKMKGKKPDKTRRVVMKLALGGLVVFIVGLIITWPIVMRFILNKSLTVREQNVVSECKSPQSDPTRLALIRRIWEKWESGLPEKGSEIGDVDSFLDRTLGQVDKMQVNMSDNRWRLYKTCLRVTRATKNEPKDSEYGKQAEQLLLRVKIEIEDQERRYFRLLQEARAAGNLYNAVEILQHIKDLLDLEHGNRESRLAQLYCDLEREIKQKQENQVGS